LSVNEAIKHAALGLFSAVALALVWGISGKAAYSLATLL
jgi:hypothetical protein